MWKKKLTIDEKINLFSSEIKNACLEELESIIVYGSVARSDYKEGVSDINFLIVVKKVHFGILLKISSIYKKWEKENIAIPLVIDSSYIRTSLDVFPLEFLEMRENSRLIYGSETLRDVDISNYSLRLELEREIKGKLLALRQGIMRYYGADVFNSYLIKTFKSFRVYIEAMLRLKGLKPAKDFSETILSFSRETGISLEGIGMLWGKYKKGEPLDKERIKEITKKYLDEIEMLADYIDKLEVKES